MNPPIQATSRTTNKIVQMLICFLLTLFNTLDEIPLSIPTTIRTNRMPIRFCWFKRRVKQFPGRAQQSCHHAFAVPSILSPTQPSKLVPVPVIIRMVVAPIPVF